MRIRIFDTTLRDGEQTVGISLTPDQKLEIAKRLDALGVDVIEAGFPTTSEGERQAARMITGEGLSSEICGMTRANKRDIDVAADTGLSYINTFVATSDIHLRHNREMTKAHAIEQAIEAVEYAKSRGLKVEFGAVDATRTERGFLRDILGEVAKAGAYTVTIPDTTGCATPEYMAELTRDAVSAAAGTPVSVHCHNDFGLAVANTLSGIRAGAFCAQVTINGIGERAGNASLEELAMALKCLRYDQKYETGIKSELIYDTSRFISKVMGIQVQPNKAVVGDNAFSHEDEIHTDAMLDNQMTYEPFSPELVGRKHQIYVGKHTGVLGLNAALGNYGIRPTEGQSRRILDRVKASADRGERITDAQLLLITREVLGEEQD